MTSRTGRIVMLAAVVLITTLRPAAAIDDTDDKVFRLSVAGGARLMALVGRDRAAEPTYHLFFPGGAMKAGWSVSVDGLWFPSFDHSISLGLAWEQRSFDLKAYDWRLPVVLGGQAETLVLAAGPLLRRVMARSLVAGDYLVVPLVWRWQVSRNLYWGAGLDVGVILRLRKVSSAAFSPSNATLQRKLLPADPAARLVAGGIVGNVAVEFAGALGVLNVDRFGGARHAAHFMIMARYIW